MAQEQAQEQPRQQTEGERIRDRKRHVIETLQTKFAEDIWRERLLKICGGDESRIMKSMNSFFAYIMNDDGGKEGSTKKYIADCSLSSISAAFLEAFQMGIEVGGGRDHAYLVNYAGTCELDISYKGFVYALSKHFDNPFVLAGCVFDGDAFTSHITDTTASFDHKPKDPFVQTWEQLRGCYCFFSYTQRDNKEKVSRLVMIHKTGPDGLEMIKSKSKGSHAWRDFPFEQVKKSTLRRAAKIPFASIDFGDMEINPETVDNRQYLLEGQDPADRLKLLLAAQRGVLAEEGKPAEAKTKAKSKPDAQQAPVDDYQAAKEQAAGKTAPEPPNETGQIIEHENFEAAKAELTDDDFNDDGVHELQSFQLFTGDGKTVTKDFPSAVMALRYLETIIKARKHKKSRKAIIEGNNYLVAALIKEGAGSAVAELHKLADEGIA